MSNRLWCRISVPMKLKSPDHGGRGDKVELDQSLIAVEGDKASMEVPAPPPVSSKIHQVGDKVATGFPDHGLPIQGAAAPWLGQAAAGCCRARPRLLLPPLARTSTCRTSVVTKSCD